MKKKTLLATALSAAGVIMSLAWFSPPPEPAPVNEEEQEILQSPFDRDPPTVEQITLQKLMTPLANGDNVIMRIKYADDITLPAQLKIYTGDNSSVMFYDDGLNTLSDTYAGDHWFGTTLNENLPALITSIQTQEDLLTEQGRMVVFNGREGAITTEIPQFNVSAFNNGLEVAISLTALRTFECGNAILRQNSLFITDLSVVEDAERTFNVINSSGMEMGAWTFGKMMQNAANTAFTGVSAKDFLKSWVRHWMEPQVVNNLDSDPRAGTFNMLINPWLTLAGATGVTEANWESKWDNATEANLLKYAPFKLTAIVNRLDLRANTAYGGEVTGERSGETRFIFSLISTGQGIAPNAHSLPGQIPIHENQDNDIPRFADWEGMNIILEYRNTCQNRCEIKDLANKWVELSQLTLGSSAYNAKLEIITNQVTNADASLQDPNHSALARIRTNERIFSQVGTKSMDFWTKDAPWQFRQFEIDPATSLLKQVPLTNTPRADANVMINQSSPSPLPSPYNINVLHWAWDPQNILKVIGGRHNLPDEYPAGTPIKAADGTVSTNFHYNFGIVYPSQYSPVEAYTTTTHPMPERVAIRHQIALNTCQGCHNSETKTVFTQIRPLGYGESANYWGSTPDRVYRRLDERGSVTRLDLGTYPSYDYLGKVNQMIPVVSAFITGRNYRGLWQTNPANYYNDDDPNDADDDNMDGLYMVGDPVNGNGMDYFNVTDKRYGFNELLRRKIDLCKIVSMGCDASSEILQIASSTSEMPMRGDFH